MELNINEYTKIQNILKEWQKTSTFEVEASIQRTQNAVSIMDFINISKRLRGKKYVLKSQEDYLNILTPSNIRFTVRGIGLIHKYCETENITEVPFEVILKDRITAESSALIGEYDINIKLKRELPLHIDDEKVKQLTEAWNSQQKAYRLIRRWSFIVGDTIVDMSMIRSTDADSTGNFKWSSANVRQIIKKLPKHEIEIELSRNDTHSDIENITKSFVKGIGEVLRGLQKNTILIKNSERSAVLRDYQELTGMKKFRGVHPITLEKQNMVVDLDKDIPNIQKQYNVTDKADGLRVLIFCNPDGELFMINGGMEIFKTGLKNETCRNSLLDGEWVTRNAKKEAVQYLMLFDVYYINSANVSILPFQNTTSPDESRWKKLQKWVLDWNSSENLEIVSRLVNDINRIQVFAKTFQFSNPENPKSIFEASSKMLNSPRSYHIDGLIFSPNDVPLPQGGGQTFTQQLKWKPIHENTIDFLVNFEKDAENIQEDKIFTTIQSDTGNTIRAKILRLHVGSSVEMIYDDPRNTVLNELFEKQPVSEKKTYRPILFSPQDFADTMASICYRELKFNSETGEEYVETENGEPIQDRTIIEMRYDPKLASGWKWIPTRVRYDKTERLQSKMFERTLNSEKVANSVWNSIHDPITESMIRTGSEEPTPEENELLTKSFSSEFAKYYERTATEKDLMVVRGMRDFHNKHIKQLLYDKTLSGGGKRLLDLASGKAGDIHRWIKQNPLFVLGIDISPDNVNDSNNGAYRRYLDTLMQKGYSNIPKILFVIGDSRRKLSNGDAGINDEESSILKSVFGKFPSELPVPKFVERHAVGALKMGAEVMSCMFALHYLFDSLASVDQFINNVDENLKPGGYFIGLSFDGKTVFDRLRSTKKGNKIIGREGDVQIWSIQKEYENEELANDDSSIGLPIDVEFMTIGMAHREYLINFEYLQKRLSTIGVDLLNSSELSSLGLKNSSEMFSTTYASLHKKYNMSQSVSEFSFMNRWYIFKRRIVRETVPEMVREEPTGVPDDSAVSSIVPTQVPSVSAASSTVPKISTAAPVVSATARKITKGEVFMIHDNASDEDVFKIGIPAPGKWLAPSAPFPIVDNDDPDKTEYPTTIHYLAGMKIKIGGKNLQVAKEIMSTRGQIHQDFISKRLTQTLGVDKDAELTIRKRLQTAEIDEISRRMNNLYRSHRIVIDDALWDEHKDAVLKEAILQRWMNDEKFKRIVEAARNAGKYLLYYKGSAENEQSGVFKDGMIKGQNKIGKMIMEIAGFA